MTDNPSVAPLAEVADFCDNRGMRRKGDTPRDTPARRALLAAEILLISGLSLWGLLGPIARWLGL